MSIRTSVLPLRSQVHVDLVGLTHGRARSHPEGIAFASSSTDHPDAAATYAQIDRRARAVAAHLQELGAPGERVLLAYPQGLEFIAGFLGCLYAGCVAVPMCPPSRRTLDRFETIALDAGASFALSTARIALVFGAAASEYARPLAGRACRWIVTGEIPDADAERWVMPLVAPDSLAMLQYTSGSTVAPKGVMLSHANVMRNAQAICEAFGMSTNGTPGATGDVGVSWLPTYHDMGLVGGVVVPLLAGATSTLLSPAEFLRDPMTWLAAISGRRATISGGPNFAYDLCVRRTTMAQRATLDLSCWKVAFVGAEPIRPETLDRFAAAFAPSGFDSRAFYPCYGLAEATLMVSGAGRGQGPAVRAFSEASLRSGQIALAREGDAGARRLVSSGKPVGDILVLIADPGTSTRAVPDRVGEVWISGSSVGAGYWGQPVATEDAFGRRPLEREGETYLRTGDLGFLCQGELFITGRRDGVLVIHGRNHHPQDLEATAGRSHSILEGGIAAAFAAEDGAAPSVTLVHEALFDGAAAYDEVIAACRTAVLAEHGVVLDRVVLVRGGAIPRTSSGKVQRRACRAALSAGGLRILAERRFTGSEPPVPCRDGTAEPPALARGASASPAPILAIVCQHAVALGGASLSDIAPDLPLEALGLDSLQRVELAARLETTFGCRLPDRDFGSAQTLGDLASVIEGRLHSASESRTPTDQIPAAHYEIAQFPEYRELRRYERMLNAVVGENPYFRVDPGEAAGPSARAGGARALIRFGVYDYLGLAMDPVVIAATKAAVDRYGASAGASRLVSGQKQVHADLERALADFLGTPSSLVFVSGHATNVITIGHLIGPEDLIVHDVLAHNSIIQGAQLSGATRRAFAHNDWKALDSLLTEVRHRHRRVLIAIEGVYSMDGDFPDLRRFVELKKRHRTLLLVDEAHSLGTMGATGRGIGEHWGVARADVDLWMGTLSKSLASCGGYIAGSSEMVEYLAYTAPGFVYSVGLSPPNAAAALAALTLLRQRPESVARLGELAALFVRLARARGLNTGAASISPVVPIIIGNSVQTLRLSSALLRRGISVHPILQPAVPEHAARLRFFITLGHSESQIAEVVDAVADELGRL